MKAIVYHKHGSPDVLKLEEVEKPKPKENEILVKVRASSINSWDWDLLKGYPIPNRISPQREPKHKILGCDIAGVVEEGGRNVKQFQPGDEVFGDLSAGNWGGFAEYVCADAKALRLKPACMTFEEAASTPQAGALAVQGLFYNGQIRQGQKILINGAGGGVGTFAIQIAKTYGAEVTGVDKAGKFDIMRSLGADHLIDYTQENFTKNGKLYDLIIDVAAYHSPSDYKRSLNTGGVYAAIGGGTKTILNIIFLGSLISLAGNKKTRLLIHKPNKGLDIIEDLFEAGKVKPVIDRTYMLKETAEAFRYFGEGNMRGKIVIAI